MATLKFTCFFIYFLNVRNNILLHLITELLLIGDMFISCAGYSM